MPEKKAATPTPFKDMYEFLHLDYNPPKGAIDCLKHAYGVVPFVREGIKRLSSLSNVK